jgi:hypothetical protein
MIDHFQNINHEAYLEFIHIPKTGGSTIENVAKENGVLWGANNKTSFSDAYKDSTPKQMCMKTNNNPVPHHIPPKYLNDDSPYSNNDTFCVIREPLERVVSEYNFLYNKQQDTDDYFTANKLNYWIENAINREDHITGDSSRITHGQCHLLPQYDYVYDDNGNITCDNPLDFAYLTQSFNALMDKHDELKSIKISPTRVDNKSIHKLSVKDISNENLVKLKRVYQKDIELYDRIHQQHTSVF